jgi:hypothetical protein
VSDAKSSIILPYEVLNVDRISIFHFFLGTFTVAYERTANSQAAYKMADIGRETIMAALELQ